MKITRRRRYYFGVITACVLIACFTLAACGILRIFGIGNEKEVIGGGPRVWSGN